MIENSSSGELAMWTKIAYSRRYFSLHYPKKVNYE